MKGGAKTKKKSPTTGWLRRFMASATAKSEPPRKPAGPARRACNVAWLVVNVLAAIALLVTAFAGYIAPEKWAPACVVVMCFSFVLPVCLLIFVLDLIWWRRTALLMGLAMIVCSGQIKAFMPLNLPRFGMSEEQKERSFTLMTYNAAKFADIPEHGVSQSEQMDYILAQSPDVVCVQEATYLAPNPQNVLTTGQLDELQRMYPYVYTQGEDLALMSKYPAEPINIDYPRKKMGGGNIGAWRLYIHDQVVNVFSVHLQSLGLSDEDKEAYEEVVKLDSVSRGELREIRHEVMPKIHEASVHRADQVRQLQKYLTKYGGRDAIVCGDFNDPVGCYGLHLLCSESGMRQAYADAAFGPDITFYANHLYFRIDHVLYRGEMYPYSIDVEHLKASDHYPTMVTFVLNEGR